jgi:murein L,D-transpeptidase YafK
MWTGLLVGILLVGLGYWYMQPKTMTTPLPKLAQPRIVVEKAAGQLHIYDGAALIRTYACIAGRGQGNKTVEGDRRTPEGQFQIVYKNPNSKFHLSLGLNYPNSADIQRGLEAGLITQAEYDRIARHLTNRDWSDPAVQKEVWYTALGGEIFIHGERNDRTGTLGCVAVDNHDIEEIFAAVPVGTPVEIKP